MAPSPSPSQRSRNSVKFTPISVTDGDSTDAAATTTKNTTDAAAASDATKTTATDYPHNSNDDHTVTLESSPDKATPAQCPDENKKRRIVFHRTFLYIVIIIVVVLVSSAVIATIVNVSQQEGGSSSTSVSVANITESSSHLIASTFPTPTCKPTDYQCPNGECLPQASRCNKVFECVDLADEANCTDCDGFVCEKTRVCLWDKMASKCDGIFDCWDLSDETSCRLRPRTQRRCKNRVLVLRSSWCDGIDDCRDNSDETNCGSGCQAHEVSCNHRSGLCVPKSSQCDGYQDCENGSDEEDCDKCPKDEFQCADLSCILGEYRCDGKPDCPGVNGEDEIGCVDVDPETNRVQMLSNGSSWIPVCSDGWMPQHSADLCLGGSRVYFTLQEKMTSSHYAILKKGHVRVIAANFDIGSECQTGKVVTLKCLQPTCGVTKLPAMRNAIAGGELSPLGKWPWVASLAYREKPICGAVLIDDQWALTAFHCVMKYYSKEPPYYFTVTYGSTSSTITNTNSNSTNQPAIRHVTTIHPHPQSGVLHHGRVTFDLALLRLSSPIQYSDTVQPICLPKQDQEFLPFSVCFLAGWGLLTDRQGLKPTVLRDTRLRVWPNSRCQTQTEAGETTLDTNATLCAGYFFGLPSGCQGDSGGPLMCLEQLTPSHHSNSNRWSVAGILSRTNHYCGKKQPNSMANQFSRVSTSTHWIQEVMKSYNAPLGINIV